MRVSFDHCLTQVIALLGQVRVVAADHPTVSMTEKLGHGRNRNTAHQRFCRKTMSIRIANHVVTKLQLLSKPAEAAPNGVSVPGLSLAVPKERPARMTLHQLSGDFDQSRREKPHPRPA